MRFLLDQNRSPRLAELLRNAGHDAVHTLELGLERASEMTNCWHWRITNTES